MSCSRIPFLFFFLLPFLAGCEKDQSSTPESGKPTGELAKTYLSPSPYEALKFHILYMDGYAPQPRAVDSVESFLDAHLRKPAGIEVVTRKVSSKGKNEYSVETMNKVIDDELRAMPATQRIHAYLLIVDGSYKGDDGNATTLGLAFRAQRMTLFGRSIQEYSNEITEPDRWKLEGSVMRHEVGHILGLVDNGTPMVNDHRDESHGAHCDNSDCLMYYTAETSDIVGDLVGSNIPSLDADCQEDLEANGGK